MSIGDPGDGFFNPILVLMMDSYSLSLGNLVMLHSNNKDADHHAHLHSQNNIIENDNTVNSDIFAIVLFSRMA